MAKILLSIPDELLASFDSYCERFSYERSEFVRKLIRDTIYPTDIQAPVDKPMAGSSTVEHLPVKEKVAGPSPALPAEKGPMVGWCQLNVMHPFTKQTFELQMITWEDENGNPIVNKKWGCQKCIGHYENIGRGRVHFVTP